MKRVVVTGATRGLGRNAVDYLLRQGIAARATGRNIGIGALLTAQGAQFIALDLATATPLQIRHLLKDVDTIWHCAALSAPWGAAADFVAANITATQNLLDGASATASSVQSFVHVSTPALYFDFRARYDVPESFRPARYANIYASTKAEGEVCVQRTAARCSQVRCVILRPRAIFGRYDQVLIPRLSRLLAQRRGRLPLPNGGRVRLDVTYAENVVHAMTLASTVADCPSGAVFNITNQQPVMLSELLQDLFAGALQRPFEIVAVPYRLLASVSHALELAARFSGREPAMTRYSVGVLGFDMTLDQSRARQILGYIQPVALPEAIARTAEWITLHG